METCSSIFYKEAYKTRGVKPIYEEEKNNNLTVRDSMLSSRGMLKQGITCVARTPDARSLPESLHQINIAPGFSRSSTAGQIPQSVTRILCAHLSDYFMNSSPNRQQIILASFPNFGEKGSSFKLWRMELQFELELSSLILTARVSQSF